MKITNERSIFSQYFYFCFRFSVIRILHQRIIYRMDFECYRFPRIGKQIFSFGSNKIDIIIIVKRMNNEQRIEQFWSQMQTSKIEKFRSIFVNFAGIWIVRFAVIKVCCFCSMKRTIFMVSHTFRYAIITFYMSNSSAWTIGCANVTKRILSIQSIQDLNLCSFEINKNAIKSIQLCVILQHVPDSN